jgi:hypothetical protein
VPADYNAFGGRALEQLNQNQTCEIIGFSCISGILEGELADGRYKLAQRRVDPVIAAVCSHINSPFTQKTRLTVACAALL